MTLDEIAIKHGCDKSSLKHDYCRIYERYFDDYDQSYFSARQGKLLEIGYGGYDDTDKGGESARMWMEKYPIFTISVTDIHPKNNVPEGVLFLQTDVTIPDCFNKHYYNTPHFDIIIDDGSHLNADIIAAFKNLWPVLNPGGLYCVEDVHSSHDVFYPDSGRYPYMGGTAMQFFLNVAHSVNIDFFTGEPDEFTYYDIEFLHFYRDLIIIKKKAA